jgi:hypothetical protein
MAHQREIYNDFSKIKEVSTERERLRKDRQLNTEAQTNSKILLYV